MSNPFSTGSPDLDALLEELRAGMSSSPRPTGRPTFRSSLGARHRTAAAPRMVYARSTGRLRCAGRRRAGVSADSPRGASDPIARLRERMQITQRVLPVRVAPYAGAPLRPEDLGRFTSVCLLFQLDTAAGNSSPPRTTPRRWPRSRLRSVPPRRPSEEDGADAPQGMGALCGDIPPHRVRPGTS